ncbi:MAG: sugar porter family MFS transporter [Kiritimatiellae bacterium]|nr:sugar porter family MFS transporter [Kiritimatiellia bacterium]
MKTAAHRRYDRFLFAMCGLAGLLYGIDMGLIAAALPYIKATCDFTETQLSGIVAAVMLGCIPGTMCAAWVAEKAGRLASLKATALVFAAAVPVICLSGGNFWAMFAGRLMQGAGCGFMGLAAALYVVECASSENRGRGTGMLQLVLTVGLVVAALIGLGATMFFGDAASDAVSIEAKRHAWQTIFWVSIIPTFVLFAGLFRLRESPRWLFKKGRIDEALASLMMNNDEETARRTIAELEANERSQMVSSADGAMKRDSLFQRKYLVPLFLAILIPVFNQASGVNSLLNYSVVLMQRAGLAGTDANWADTAIKVANFLFTCVAMALVDRKGRKFLLTLGSAGVTLGLLAVGGLFLAVEHGALQAGPFAGWAIVAAFILFIASFAIGPGVCVWLAMTELMPLRVRAGGMMVAQFVAMGVSYTLAQTFLPWSARFGDSSVFLTLAVVAVGYFVTSAFFLPETKGRSLEEIERHFARR